MSEAPFNGFSQQDRNFISGISSEFFINDSGVMTTSLAGELNFSKTIRVGEPEITYKNQPETWRGFNIDADGIYLWFLVSGQRTNFYFFRNGNIDFNIQSLHEAAFETIPAILSPDAKQKDPLELLDSAQAHIYSWIDEDDEGTVYDMGNPDSASDYFSRMYDTNGIRRVLYVVENGSGLDYEFDIFNILGFAVSAPIAISLPRGMMWEKGLVEWALKNHRLSPDEVRRGNVLEDLTYILNLIQYRTQ